MKDYDIVVRIVDKGEAPNASKAGDVIEIKEVGHVWSETELRFPDWRIIRARMLPSTALALLAAPATDQDGINKGHRRRDWKVDLSLLPDPSKFAGSNREPVIEITTEALMGSIKQKPNPVDDGIKN